MGASVQAVFYILALTAERYLRHAGRLHPNFRRREKVCAGFAIFFGIVGQAGIILVACFNTVHHHKIHISMLAMFIVGLGISVVFTTFEFFQLDRAYKELNRLRISYFLKIVWFFCALALALFFVGFWAGKLDIVAAVFEWSLSFFYGFYLLILAYDLYPAAATKKGDLLEREFGTTLSRAASWLPGLRTQSHASNDDLEQNIANDAPADHYMTEYNQSPQTNIPYYHQHHTHEASLASESGEPYNLNTLQPSSSGHSNPLLAPTNIGDKILESRMNNSEKPLILTQIH